MKKFFSLFEGKHYRYLLVGMLVFAINYEMARWVFQLDYFKGSLWQKNLGNFLAMESALLLSYPLHKRITWLEGWEDFLPKLLRFHAISFLGILIRILAFASLAYLGFGWSISTIVSIVLVVLINFLGFDQFVFQDKLDIATNENAYSTLGTGSTVLETIEDAEIYNRYIANKISDYLGAQNIEMGAGKGTIASLLVADFSLHLFELSKENQAYLRERFQKNPKILSIRGDIFQAKELGSYDCIYSSNVLEHIPEDIEVIRHCMKLLKQGGFFVALVPAMPFLYSSFDRSIGHYRRYSKKDKIRISEFLSLEFKFKWLDYSYYNPIGAIGWLIKMKLLRTQSIKKRDAMLMNSIIPFVSFLDHLPLGFGQSLQMVIKKL